MLEMLLDILLGILAFLGITLLVLFGLVLLVLLLVLFVPIRYTGEFNKDAEIMQVRLKISWLLRIVRVFVDYKSELLIKAFILFFKVYDSTKPAKEKNVKEKRANKQTYSGKKEKNEQEQKDIIAQENMETTDREEQIANPGEKTVEENIANNTDNVTDSVEKETKESFIQKIKGKIQNIICKCKSICDKIKSIVQNINYYIEIIKEEETIALLGRGKLRLLKILKSIRPRKLQADVIVGTGAPDTTGYLMAVAGMFYPTFGKSVNIVPDFENTIFEGRIYLKGRITVFILLVHALAVYLDKDIHKTLKKLKREDA